MGFPAALNVSEIDCFGIDAENVGLAPALAMGNLYMSTSYALGLVAVNAAMQQQQIWQVGMANTSKSIANIWATQTSQ